MTSYPPNPEQDPNNPLGKPSDQSGAGGYPPPAENYPPPAANYPPPGASYPPPQGAGYPPPNHPAPGQESYGSPYGQSGPSAYPPPPIGDPGYGVAPQVSIGAALSYGWDKFKANALSWILIALISVVVNAVVSFAFRGFDTDNFTATTSALSLIGSLVSMVVGVLFQAAYIRGALAELDGQKPPVGKFFQFNNIGVVFGLAIVVGIVTAIGLFIVIIPGIVILYLTWYVLTFAIDRNNGFVDSIKSSVRLTTSNVGALLPLAIVCALLNVVGFLLCLIGLLVSIPVTLIAGTYAYRVLTQGQVSPARV